MTGKVEGFTYRTGSNEVPARDKIASYLKNGYRVTGVYASSQENLYNEHLDRLLLTPDVFFTVIIDSDLDGRHQEGRRELYTYYKILELKVDSSCGVIKKTSEAVSDAIIL